jgi:Kef-type K+ transport system membrane component KefB
MRGSLRQLPQAWNPEDRGHERRPGLKRMFDWLQRLTPPSNLTGATLVAYVLLDVFLIVVLARLLGSLMVRVGQARVVGEILAGVLLGPTLLGRTLSEVIAPLAARPGLSAIGTLALILFMFLAGVEYEAGRIKGRVAQAGALAVLSVIVPAALGFPVARAMYTPAYAGPAAVSLLPFALFIGATLSVTAFPVMAHMLMQRGELNSHIGSLGVATAGLMSLVMFTYIALAGAVAAGKGFGGLFSNVVLMLLFVLVSWCASRPLLARVLRRPAGGEVIDGNGMAVVLSGMVLYGWIADRIGINALVGGFAWGLILPEDPTLRGAVAGKVRDVAMILFLPVFFAMAGFSTDLRLIGAQTLPVVLLVLAAAIAGKFLAAVPARAFGLSWREVGMIGTLCNTRGLLVLVAGLIGLQLSIITVLTFTIVVVVALVTNLMTLPLLNLLSRPTAQPLVAMGGVYSMRGDR